MGRIIVGAVAAVLLVFVGAVVGMLLTQNGDLWRNDSAELQEWETIWEEDEVGVPVLLITATLTPYSTIAVSDTSALAEPAASDPLARVTVTPTPAASPTPVPVLFQVNGDEVYFRDGPGTSYPSVARAGRDAVLPVTGRTADGSWWQICCLDNKQLWMPLEGVLLLSGDVGSVPILDVVVYNNSQIGRAHV